MVTTLPMIVCEYCRSEFLTVPYVAINARAVLATSMNPGAQTPAPPALDSAGDNRVSLLIVCDSGCPSVWVSFIETHDGEIVITNQVSA